MPCSVSPEEARWYEERFKRERREKEVKFPTGYLENDQLEAILCGIFSTLNKPKVFKAMLDSLDYKEMGVTREQVEVWWEIHKERDKKRKKNK